MPRILRVDVAGQVYHVLNRANARVQIFDQEGDYDVFERILEEGIKRFEMRLFSYCIMPNHWHLVVCTKNDGDLARFIGWLTNTHTRRWHTSKQTVGSGHLYQGRYKSFICKQDQYFLTLCRYVERNARKANLVSRVEQWRWGSAWRRQFGSLEQKRILSDWLLPLPDQYLEWLNEPQTASEEDAIKHAIVRNNPFGDPDWTAVVVEKFNLLQTVRPPNRPRKGG
jgi:putative transposase